MSATDNDDVLSTADELTALKERADLLGVKYHPSISLEKLREKVNASIEGIEPEAPKKAAKAALIEDHVETDAERRARKKKEANELIRIRVTCMNPAKSEWEGEIFTAGNSLVGSFTKYVPFNAEDGWHVPRIIYNQIIQRQCQIFVTVRDSRGNSTRKGKLIKEFAVEVMPNLTAEELHDLAQRQAMAKSVD
jgi:hypothetical protein